MLRCHPGGTRPSWEGGRTGPRTGPRASPPPRPVGSGPSAQPTCAGPVSSHALAVGDPVTPKVTQARHARLDPGTRSPQAPASAPHCLWPGWMRDTSEGPRRPPRLAGSTACTSVSPDLTPNCSLPLCRSDVSLPPTRPPRPEPPVVGIWGHRLSWKAVVQALRTGATCGSIGLRTARARPQPAAPTDRERGLGEAACPSAGLSGFVSMCVCIKESVTSDLMRRSGNRRRSAPGAATCWSCSVPGLASPATAQGRLTHVLSGPSPKPCCRAPCSFDSEARGARQPSAFPAPWP